MTIAADIALTLSCEKWLTDLPEAEAICRRAAAAALSAAHAGAGEIGVVLADDDAMRDFNRRYRGIDRATNVLAFALAGADAGSEDVPAGAPVLLGDVVVALETAAGEAREQGKSLGDHLSHLVVHGTLHLLGHDHEAAAEAARMERLEALALSGLGIADPYAQSGLAPAGAEP